MRKVICGAAAGVLLAGAAAAQTPGQPYAGLETRPVKALSEQQISDLKDGRGMGLALAAELNGYPGPVHVLEHAPDLALSPAQRARVEGLFAAMKAEAVPLGHRLIAQEAELEHQFARRTVTVDSLAAATRAIAETQAALRAAHLKYHLSTAEVLTQAQSRRYAELRGYAGTGTRAPAHGAHGHPTHRK